MIVVRKLAYLTELTPRYTPVAVQHYDITPAHLDEEFPELAEVAAQFAFAEKTDLWGDE